MHSLVRLVLVAGFALLMAALWQRESLPGPREVREEMSREPAQRAVDRPSFETRVGGIAYRIQPRFSYELYGVVVSRHDAAAWWDYIHKEWNDKLNVVDLCVVWGDNVRGDAYRAIDYSHDQWTCWAQTGSSEAWQAFDMAAMSNNHLITDDPQIATALRRAGVGDQVRVRGYLADYATFKNGAALGQRVSSSVRSDTGNGACEIIYVEDFGILQAGGGPWRRLAWVAAALLGAALVAWFFLPDRFAD